jgi:DNA-directed RNA polymerase sigma subunit (sigma70/sigma32)
LTPEEELATARLLRRRFCGAAEDDRAQPALVVNIAKHYLNRGIPSA